MKDWWLMSVIDDCICDLYTECASSSLFHFRFGWRCCLKNSILSWAWRPYRPEHPHITSEAQDVLDGCFWCYLLQFFVLLFYFWNTWLCSAGSRKRLEYVCVLIRCCVSLWWDWRNRPHPLPAVIFCFSFSLFFSFLFFWGGFAV